MAIRAIQYPLLDRVDLLRQAAARDLDRARKKELGQFMTQAPVAALMASMLIATARRIHILDPGAGVGMLFSACVAELCARRERPESIRVTAYELDPAMLEYLGKAVGLCHEACEDAGIRFQGCVVQGDFIKAAVDTLSGGFMDSGGRTAFNCVILNPPYGKIHSDSTTRKQLREIGVETSNLYTGFVAAALRLLEESGELIAITPRSFCSGSYFRTFREDLLRSVSLDRIHVFESRKQAFRDDRVLQENVILHAIKLPAMKGEARTGSVTVSMSADPDDKIISIRDVAYHRVIHPGDPQSFIHIVLDESGEQLPEIVGQFPCSLSDLGLRVSTGRVVDFRARDYLRQSPGPETAALIYPGHFCSGRIEWPQARGKKPDAIAITEGSVKLLVPNVPYVLVKRFTSKEEKKRVVTVVHDPAAIPGDWIGLENHLNYFHQNGGGLTMDLARGLAAFLNSTLIDAYFRQFNGHTQVNATDLRSMKYPSAERLEALGRRIGARRPEQLGIDTLVHEVLVGDV